MKKQTKIGFLFMIFLAVALFVSAEVSALELNPFANSKTFVPELKEDMSDFLKEDFNSKYGVIQLSKTMLWFETDRIAEYSLTENTDQCLINCESGGRTTLYEEGKLFDKFDIYNRKGEGVNLKELKVYVKEIEIYYEDVPQYKEVCSFVETTSNTTLKEPILKEPISQEVCNQEVVGYDKVEKTREVWNEYNFETLPSGNYEWKIIATKDKIGAVDWIPTTKGKKLDEWAWYNSDWEYKRLINLTANVGNFSYLYEVHYSENMQNDYDDLRFVNSAEDTELNFTIQSYNSTRAVVRIYSQGETEIYMYYGNPLATSASSASDTHFNPVAYYYLDETFGTTAVDSLGLNDGINNGATVNVAGKIDKAYSFDGSNDYVEVPNTGQLNFASVNSFSVNSWVYANNLGDTNQYSAIVSQGGYSALEGFEITINQCSSPLGRIDLIVKVSGCELYLESTTQHLTTGSWQMITATFNSTTAVIYKNGNIVASGVNNCQFKNSNRDMVIGKRDPINTNYKTIDGKIDEVGIWDKVLTPEQIYQLYTYTAPTYTIGEEEDNEGVSINLNSPADELQSTSSEINFNATITPINADIKNVTLYLNGQEYLDLYNTNETINYSKILSLADGSYTWNISACWIGESLVEYCTESETRTFEIDATLPNITVLSGNGTYDYWYSGKNHSVVFNVTDDNLDKVIWEYNGTNHSISGFGYYFMSNTTEMGYDMGSSFVKVREFNIPSNVSFNTYVNNVTAKIKNNGFEIKEVLISYVYKDGTTSNQTNQTTSPEYTTYTFINPNVTKHVNKVEIWCREAQTSGMVYLKDTYVYYEQKSPLIATFENIKNINNLTIYAEDTFGNLATEEVEWDYLISETGKSFNPETFTTKEEYFYLNFTTPTAIIPVVYLEYNGTEYLSTRIGTSTNHQISNTLIPNTIGNISFRWKITWGTNTVYTPYYTQTVKEVSFLNFTSGNCAAGLTNVMNFVFKDEGNQTDLTGVNIKYNFEYGITGGTGAYSYGSINAVTKLALCINTSTAPTYDVGYGEIEYVKEGYTTRRYYIFDGTRLTNVTTNTTLYSLPNGDSTSFLLEVRSPTLQPYVDIYTSLLRWYPNLNEYRIVEMGNTDNKGQTVFKVKIEDVDYRIGIYNKNGSLIYIINPVRMVCLVSPCSYTINVPVTTRDYLKEILGMETLIIYEDGMFTLTYNDPTQNTEMIRFVITQFTGVRDTVICETNGTSFTGILTCNVSGYEGTLKAVAYRTASPENPIALKIVQIGETVFQGTFGLFLQFLISIVLAFLGIINPMTAIILGLIAMVFGVMVIKTITYPILIAFSVLGGIIIYMMRRNT